MADTYKFIVKRAIYRECCALSLDKFVRDRLMQAITKIQEDKMLVQVQTFEEAVETVMQEMTSIMIDRQRKYGHRNILEFGEMGILVRASDKLARLKNFYIDKQGQEVSDESLDDTWTDLANYAIISLMLRKGIFERPLKETLNNAK